MEEEMRRTVRVQMLDNQHLTSSDDEQNFAKLNKIAGKYKKDGK